MPFVESMLVVLRNNKLITRKKENSFETKKNYLSQSTKLKSFPKATPELLLEIKQKLKNQRRKQILKTTIVFSIIILLLTVMIHLF